MAALLFDVDALRLALAELAVGITWADGSPVSSPELFAEVARVASLPGEDTARLDFVESHLVTTGQRVVDGRVVGDVRTWVVASELASLRESIDAMREHVLKNAN